MCTFVFELPVDPVLLLPALAAGIADHGGVMTGAPPTVTVSVPTKVGLIEGACTVMDGDRVTVEITTKPDFVPCAMVRDRLVDYLTAAVKAQAAQAAAVE